MANNTIYINEGEDKIEITRYTTPLITTVVEDNDLEKFYLTMKDGSVVVEKDLSAATITDNKVQIRLAMAETYVFSTNTRPQIQARYKTNSGIHYATPIQEVTILPVLKDKLI